MIFWIFFFSEDARKFIFRCLGRGRDFFTKKIIYQNLDLFIKKNAAFGNKYYSLENPYVRAKSVENTRILPCPRKAPKLAEVYFRACCLIWLD